MSSRQLEASASTVYKILSSARFAIDYYQREYAWQSKQARELVGDLTMRFRKSYVPGHDRREVGRYGRYFLGSIVTCLRKDETGAEKPYLVDGQQRLTTLTLLLVVLYKATGVAKLLPLIASERYGINSYNLEVPARQKVMDQLLGIDNPAPLGDSESVRNILARYADVEESLFDAVDEAAMPFFIDWLLDHVHLVEIKTYSTEDAYTIFETVNDRGLPLSKPDMLKAYILGQLRDEAEQKDVDRFWKGRLAQLSGSTKGGDENFFKDWLRAQYAQTMRPGGKGQENQDNERIGTEFHRWVRDHDKLIGLTGSQGFQRFVSVEMDFYSRQSLLINAAAQKVHPGLESIFYNADRGFTLQNQLLLAALSPDDASDVIIRKLQLVADFIDIWLARRIWNSHTVLYDAVRYTLFNITKEIRRAPLAKLSAALRARLDAQEEEHSFAGAPNFTMHQQNQSHVRHILARLSHWLDRRAKLESHFEDLVAVDGRRRPYEIEHLWPKRPERFVEAFPQMSDFLEARNRIGGLVLLRTGTNQSLSDAPFEEKRDAYVSHGQSLLTRSLHPNAYQNIPQVSDMLRETGLNLKPYEVFGVDEQRERQELYIRLAEWVWNPSRLDLDGEKPPVKRPLGLRKMPSNSGQGSADGDRPLRQRERAAFWAQLLDYAKDYHDIGRNRPTFAGDVGFLTSVPRILYSYFVTRNGTRVQLYIDTLDVKQNKKFFDILLAKREDIESRFGASLQWERGTDQRSSRVWFPLDVGGWGDRARWGQVTQATVAAMLRFREVFDPELVALRQRLEESGEGDG